jgi:hypothetical protein
MFLVKKIVATAFVADEALGGTRGFHSMEEADAATRTALPGAALVMQREDDLVVAYRSREQPRWTPLDLTALGEPLSSRT